jgi:ketosteroid isomerase-like protein
VLATFSATVLPLSFQADRGDLPALSGRSGAEVEFNYWCVVTFRQGRIVREHWFADRAEALEAAGLSE